MALMDIFIVHVILSVIAGYFFFFTLILFALHVCLRPGLSHVTKVKYQVISTQCIVDEKREQWGVNG